MNLTKIEKMTMMEKIQIIRYMIEKGEIELIDTNGNKGNPSLLKADNFSVKNFWVVLE